MYGDLYKQAMATCASTKKLGAKVFYQLIIYKLNSEKYYNFIFATEIWIWVLLVKLCKYTH